MFNVYNRDTGVLIGKFTQDELDKIDFKNDNFIIEAIQ
jgi:hypothetical protein